MWFNSHHPVAYSKQTKKSIESESPTSASRSLSLLKLTGQDDDLNSERSCFLQLWEDSPKDVCMITFCDDVFIEFFFICTFNV